VVKDKTVLKEVLTTVLEANAIYAEAVSSVLEKDLEGNPIPSNDMEDIQFRAHLVSLNKTKEEIEIILALRKRAYGT
jgi:hypothetical protein